MWGLGVLAFRVQGLRGLGLWGGGLGFRAYVSSLGVRV